MFRVHGKPSGRRGLLLLFTLQPQRSLQRGRCFFLMHWFQHASSTTGLIRMPTSPCMRQSNVLPLPSRPIPGGLFFAPHFRNGKRRFFRSQKRPNCHSWAMGNQITIPLAALVPSWKSATNVMLWIFEWFGAQQPLCSDNANLAGRCCTRFIMKAGSSAGTNGWRAILAACAATCRLRL